MKALSTLAGVATCAVAALVATSSAAGPRGHEAPVLLDQGWSQDERNLFHYTSTCSTIRRRAASSCRQHGWRRWRTQIPPGGRFMAPENTARYGLIPDTPSAMNPYGWPIGVAIDTEMPDGIPQAGPTCAFCHTGQVAYRGRSVRIEGGQANVVFRAFGTALVRAIQATATDPARRARFMEAAVRLGYPKARIEGDFQAVYWRTLEKLQDDPLGQMVLDTKEHGNSNAGHWFADDTPRPGRIGRAFTEPEKLAIIEYLKAATEADYPTVQFDPPGPAPCANDPDWAKNWPATRAR